eukprot:3626656-Prymnesium_polylepis.2
MVLKRFGTSRPIPPLATTSAIGHKCVKLRAPIPPGRTTRPVHAGRHAPSAAPRPAARAHREQPSAPAYAAPGLTIQRRRSGRGPSGRRGEAART